jgi:hypothetical protein
MVPFVTTILPNSAERREPPPPTHVAKKRNFKIRKGGKMVTPLRKGGKMVTPLRKGGKMVIPPSQGGKMVTPLRKGGKRIGRSRRRSIARNKNTRLETVPLVRSTPTFHRLTLGVPSPDRDHPQSPAWLTSGTPTLFLHRNPRTRLPVTVVIVLPNLTGTRLRVGSLRCSWSANSTIAPTVTAPATPRPRAPNRKPQSHHRTGEGKKGHH